MIFNPQEEAASLTLLPHCLRSSAFKTYAVLGVRENLLNLCGIRVFLQHGEDRF